MSRENQNWLQSPFQSEPSLRDVFNDPIVHLVMARDRLHHDDVRALMCDAARRLKQSK